MAGQAQRGAGQKGGRGQGQLPRCMHRCMDRGVLLDVTLGADCQTALFRLKGRKQQQQPKAPRKGGKTGFGFPYQIVSCYYIIVTSYLRGLVDLERELGATHSGAALF